MLDQGEVFLSVSMLDQGEEGVYEHVPPLDIPAPLLEVGNGTLLLPHDFTGTKPYPTKSVPAPQSQTVPDIRDPTGQGPTHWAWLTIRGPTPFLLPTTRGSPTGSPSDGRISWPPGHLHEALGHFKRFITF